MAAVYDLVMRETEEACLKGWREELLAGVSGEVLEVGAGTGANLAHYPLGRVTRLHLAEPDPHMRRRLEEATRGLSHPTPIEITEHGMEALPYADASFDNVVATLVLCSVGDAFTALAEAHRVLRPNGRLLFIEHVAAHSGSSRRRWQGLMEPLWRRVAGNCHLTRRTEAAITRAGLRIETIERESMRGSFPWVRPSIRGVAAKPL